MYGTIIIKDNIAGAIKHLSGCKKLLKEDGNLFVMVQSEIDTTGDVTADFFDVVYAADKEGYSYINTMVVPTEEHTASELPDNVLYIVWLAQTNKQFFNKDSIREKHIWKDVEWGKRAKNYNPKGKDPGNVWIPTVDDGKANITDHILLDFPTIINRLVISTKQPDYKTLLISNQMVKESVLPDGVDIRFVKTQQTSVKFDKVYKPAILQKAKDLFGKVIWGTSEDMSAVENGTVEVVVTSPPYWDLKDYFKEGQIGQESYQQYLDRLYSVWNECYKKLSSTGSLWLNINIRVKKGKVILIPRDFIIQCKKIGFHYKGILIWHKSSGIPTHDRNIVDHYEYVLVFSKGQKLNINQRILDYSDYKNPKINAGLFWNINRKAGSVGKQFIHPAIYPNGLVTRVVEVTTKEGDLVLDPFLGSGTTLISSVLAGRNCIGFEYNEGFKELIMDRITNEVNIPFKLEI